MKKRLGHRQIHRRKIICGHARKVATCQPRREVSEETRSNDTLTLNLQPSELWDNKCLLFKRARLALCYGRSSRRTHLTSGSYFWTLLSSVLNVISLFFLTLTFFCSAFFLSPTCLFPSLTFFTDSGVTLGRYLRGREGILHPASPGVLSGCSPELPSAPSLQGYSAKSCNIIRRRASPFLGDSDHATQLSEFLFSHMLKKNGDA